jgi:hypothetical protein
MDRSKTRLVTSLLIILLGLALMTYMIIVEDEPGALPLALIIGGAIWFGLIRYKTNNTKN